MIDFQPGQNAAGLTLHNPGDTPLYGQVRVYRWDQNTDSDELQPTNEVIASPPLIQVAAGGDQLVRLIQISPGNNSSERVYRILIDELPAPGESPQSGVTIRLRYSVPVFVEPSAGEGHPSLTWQLSRNDKNWYLTVINAGTGYAKISGVQIVDTNGTPHPINSGLLGYALPGRTRRWAVSMPGDVASGGTFKIDASVNSQPTEVKVPVATAN